MVLGGLNSARRMYIFIIKISQIEHAYNVHKRSGLLLNDNHKNLPKNGKEVG